VRDGNIIVKIETINDRGEEVLEGSAEIAQSTTVYVFTSQGSQEAGTRMDLYNPSPAARAVWDGMDAHLLVVYGFSMVEIVKDNPMEKTIHFGGIKDQAIRRRYMDMTYDTIDEDGQVKTFPLFDDINVRTPKYTFSHLTGLLFATQFAQIALVVTKKAAFKNMRYKGFVQNDFTFAGHSLGEYSALAFIVDVLPISSLVDVVFYRGITMQRAVERDSANRLNYRDVCRQSQPNLDDPLSAYGVNLPRAGDPDTLVTSDSLLAMLFHPDTPFTNSSYRPPCI
jgi:fatty acid synthase subunit alpha